MDWQAIHHRIKQMTKDLTAMQSPDGSWRMCIDCGTMSDCYALTVIRLLDIRDETLIQELARRIVSRREPGGVWKLFPDEHEGSLDATAEAVLALLISGLYNDADPIIVSAKQYIRSQGGLSKSRSLLTQSLLCAAGQAEWPQALRIPLSALFSRSGPLPSLFLMSGHARVHFIPIIIMANKRFSLRTAHTPDLSSLFLGSSRRFENDSPIVSVLNGLFGSVAGLLIPDDDKLYEQAVSFLLERIEPDGTLLTYSTASAFLMLTLIAVGHPPSDPVIAASVRGIRSLLCGDPSMVQIATPTVWDTGMLAHALNESGMPVTSEPMQRAARYLRQRQHTRYGDWTIRNPGVAPGGWGFSNVSTRYPDNDSTHAAMRVLQMDAPSSPGSTQAAADNWERGLNWLLTMRNDDGGWPAFERNGKPLPAGLFGFAGAADIVNDLSTPDLTGRVMQYLGWALGLTTAQQWLDHSAKWVLSQQEKDGSWFGRWGITYTHGTGAAVLGLTAIGVKPDHAAITKAVHWLLSVQNNDGGWGESCYSDQQRHYVPLGISTLSQTAWALDALIAAQPKPTKELERGTDALLRLLDSAPRRLSSYPTGAGLAGMVYVHYESNNWIWPLLTLSRLVRKFGS
ncbi:prenyltransferase/squalene oxidase repeat-containing protein [Paenibacillus kobensis]|uniref:prenyltransferase/squalene oxidase repeat-containing protein n=1 Tax=Paenibacillus kobensis TaxID=59841 RepID=UPI001FE89388|nr:prenyltransferase/squalene oxidase repeat-containing protein [Paenibacillus kobensis]